MKNFHHLKFLSIASILERSNGRGSHNRVLYEGHSATLECSSKAYPNAYIAWLKNGVVIQNRTTDTDLRWTVNDTKGSNIKYECYATNKHGKDYYPIDVTIAGMHLGKSRPLGYLRGCV